jgi:hypothetical protein
MKTRIEKYKVGGKVYIWTFKENSRNYPEWNFTVDLKASKSLSELLDFMNKCEWSTNKTIKTEKPTRLQLDVPNNLYGTAKSISKSNMTFKCKTTETTNHWLIKETDNGIEVQFGKEKLIELQNAINGIPENRGDFAISDNNDNNILYFWWNLDK